MCEARFGPIFAENDPPEKVPDGWKDSIDDRPHFNGPWLNASVQARMELFHVASHTDRKVEAEAGKSNNHLQMETKAEDGRFAKLQDMLSHQKDTAKKILDLEDNGMAVKEDVGGQADSKNFGVQKRSKKCAENETTEETDSYTKD